jgi:hypothetical protein
MVRDNLMLPRLGKSIGAIQFFAANLVLENPGALFREESSRCASRGRSAQRFRDYDQTGRPEQSPIHLGACQPWFDQPSIRPRMAEVSVAAVDWM